MPLRLPATPPLRALVALFVLTALLVGPTAATADEAPKGKDAPAKPKPKPKKPPKQKPLYWGAWIGDQLTGTGAPWDMGAVTKFEETVGKGLSIVEFSQPFADCGHTPCIFTRFPRPQMDAIRAYGAIPFYSWGSQSIPAAGPEQPDFQLADVNAGTYDEYIRRFAEEVRDWGHPFFLRFDWEMNGFWFPWNEGVNGNKKGEFVEAWRHVHRIFTSVGANNVNWVWCPNVDFTRKLVPLKDVYPGNRYVDWTCLDGFNWGDTTYSAGWMSFNAIFKSTYQRVAKLAPKKPMLIAETASEERGGSKSNWIKNALAVIPREYPKVRGLIWFNEESQEMRWPIESSSAAQSAFRKGIKRGVYRPNLYSDLPGDKIRPPR
jgi:beta-mannanase